MMMMMVMMMMMMMMMMMIGLGIYMVLLNIYFWNAYTCAHYLLNNKRYTRYLIIKQYFVQFFVVYHENAIKRNNFSINLKC